MYSGDTPSAVLYSGDTRCKVFESKLVSSSVLRKDLCDYGCVCSILCVDLSASCPGDNEQESVWQQFAVASVHRDI